jgi:hypothetical protein
MKSIGRMTNLASHSGRTARIGRAGWIFTFLAGIFWSLTALAQSGMTGEQVRLVQELPESERQAIIEAVIESADGSVSNAPIAFPGLVIPPELEDNGEDEEEDEPAFFAQSGAATPEELRLPFFRRSFKLEPFGYGLFAAAPTTFAPATDIPVPLEYKIGPGDTIEVQLFGKENRQYSLVVNRDGTINFPSLGPVSATGQSYQELKQQILDRISENMLGTSAAITMGALRSIRVFLLGDARAPGSYTVSGLSTITNALYVSGGVS